MKLYKNISRFRWRRMFSKGSVQERKLLWASTLKPGDFVAACTGFNVKIATIEPQKAYARNTWGGYFRGNFNGRSNGWYIYDFLVIDDQGQSHYIMSCCDRKETASEIEEYWRRPRHYSAPRLTKIHQLLAEGKRICDDDGVVIPELDHKLWLDR